MGEQLKTSYLSLKVCVTGNDHHSPFESQTPGDPLRDTRQAPQEDSGGPSLFDHATWVLALPRGRLRLLCDSGSQIWLLFGGRSKFLS